MSDSVHLIVLIAAAIAIAAELTIGTLAAADLLPSKSREVDGDRRGEPKLRAHPKRQRTSAHQEF